MTITAAAPATGSSLTARLVAGIDPRCRHERDADLLAQRIAGLLTAAGASSLTVATHWAQVQTDRHVALSVEAAGVDADTLWQTLLSECSTSARSTSVHDSAGAQDADLGLVLGARRYGAAALCSEAARVIEAHLEHSSGRVVVFPGADAIQDRLSVAELLAASAIERVQVLASDGPPTDAMPIVTRQFLRPRWVGGILVLHTQPAAGETLVPFETPNPTPCCADH
ncbi:hypothetical protein BH10ACT8_BH10ACT8_04550 [soil metagenome]